MAMRLAFLGAGVSLSLQSASAHLDIQRLSVLSVRGEPLRAVAVVRTEPGEQIAQECLSLGDESDIPSPDYPLLRNARITLSAAGDAIEISTDDPVTLPAIAVVLRVRCPGESLTARHFNLLMRQTSDVVRTRTATATRTYGRGIQLTILHDETVASIAHSIHPSNRKARRELEEAIVAANPELFPLGKPKPLKSGTRLLVPDLRDVRELAAAGAQLRAQAAAEGVTPAPLSPGPEVKPALPEGEPAEERRLAAVEPRLPKRLKLRLARSELNLKRSAGVGDARREELRRLYRGEVVTVTAAGTEALELRIAELRESQSAINSQLARLEEAVEALHRSMAAMVSAPPPTPRPQPPRPTPQPVVVTEQTPWMFWAAAAAGALLLSAIAFMLGRRMPSAAPVDEHEARIDALLEQARAAAGPLLRPEPGARSETPAARRPLPSIITAAEPPRARVRPAPPPVAPPPEELPLAEEIPPTEEMQLTEEMSPPVEAPAESLGATELAPLPALPDLLIEAEAKGETGLDMVLEAEPKPEEPPAQQGGVENGLKREMDLALNSARSMFTDVDRFISLGRTQNAISLLEFQVHKDPNDRDAWVKLMAVYRQEGMEAEFQRAFAEFKRKFPGEV
jgi:hypothetical protein